MPFASFNTRTNKLTLHPNRGSDYGKWLCRFWIDTVDGRDSREVKTKQRCTFDELRSQVIIKEVESLFDENSGVKEGGFTVVKLRA